MIRILLTSLCAIALLTACQPAEKKLNALEQLEMAYQQDASSENAQALVRAYEAQIDTTSSVEAEILLRQKAATTYFSMGLGEGLQTNFTQLIQKHKGNPAATAAAKVVMDSLLHNITDPTTGRLKPVVAKQYISLTEVYAKSLPDSPESPEQLYKSGEIARSIGDYQKALNIYSTVESYFPQYEKASKALFMQAFTYAEDLKNEEEARRLYEAFIEKYPEDDFVDDAQILLSTLGKSDEEIFQALEKE